MLVFEKDLFANRLSYLAHEFNARVSGLIHFEGSGNVCPYRFPCNDFNVGRGLSLNQISLILIKSRPEHLLCNRIFIVYRDYQEPVYTGSSFLIIGNTAGNCL
jgi:hypothetical protein